MGEYERLKAQKDATEAAQREKIFSEDVVMVFRHLEEYSRDEIALSRLGELLNQSPPVVRAVIVRAAKKMSGES